MLISTILISTHLYTISHYIHNSGVHSVYDLLAGAILGVTLMSLLHVYGDALDVVLYQYSGALYVQLALLAVYFGE